MWRLELVDHDGFQRPCFFSSQRDSSSARRHCVFSAVSSMREQRSLTALRPSLPAQGSSLAAFCPFLLLCGLAWRRTFFSGAVVSRGILGAPCFFFPLLWSAAAWRRISLFFGLACCNAQVAAVLHASRHLHAYLDAGAWHVQQLARVVRKPAALQRLRQPAAPPSIFFSQECIVARTGQPPCVLQPGGAFVHLLPPSREMRRRCCYAFTRSCLLT
jgi:hypothetical protein